MCVHTQNVSEEQKQLKGAGTRLTAEMISTAYVRSSSDDSAPRAWRKAGLPRTREVLPSRSQLFSGTSREQPVSTSAAPGAPRFVASFESVTFDRIYL